MINNLARTPAGNGQPTAITIKHRPRSSSRLMSPNIGLKQAARISSRLSVSLSGKESILGFVGSQPRFSLTFSFSHLLLA